MSDQERWFRITAVVPMAVTPATGDPPVKEALNRSAAERVRLVAQRMRGRMDAEVREVVLALVDAVGSLEQDVRRLQQQVLLYEAGVTLQPELATLGGDGVRLPRSSTWPVGTPVHVILTLAVRGSEHLLTLAAEVAPCDDPGATELIFTGVRQDQRDLIVAFGFQQQAKERRRDLDSASTA